MVRHIIVLLLLIWTVLSCCTEMANMDIWWHLKTGELILERGSVPWADWYTYTDPGRPWTDLHWGFQLLAVSLYRLGGVPLLVLSKAFCAGLAVWTGWRSVPDGSPEWKAICWMPAVICISGRSIVRPEMLTTVFLALSLFLGVQAAERPKLLRWFPLLMLVWVNCHALFVLGLVVLGCLVIECIVPLRLRRKLDAEAKAKLTLRTAGGMLVASLALCFVNPYLDQGVLFPLELFRKFSSDHELYSSIGEFQRPADFIRQHGVFSNVYVLALVVLWLMTAMSFLFAMLGRRLSLFRLLVFAAFSYLAIQASRNTNLFAVAAASVLTANVGRLTETSRDQNALRSLARWSVCAVLIALCVGQPTGWWNQISGEPRQFGLSERPNWYAHEACEFAGQAGMPSNAFLVPIGQAGVFDFHNGPDRKVFQDGRLEVTRRETFHAYLQASGSMASLQSEDWRGIIRGGHEAMPVVVLDTRYGREQIRGMAIAAADWRLVYADRTAAVFVEESVAGRLKLPEADPAPLLEMPE